MDRAQRNVAIDMLKAFAIMAVVLGHIASPFSKFIFSWHMPAFFFLSGILMCFSDHKKERSFEKSTKKDLLYLGRV